MSERLLLQGALSEKKRKRMTMAAESAGIIKALKVIIQPAAITKLKDLKTNEALALIKSLHELKVECMALDAEIEEIKRELGGE